MILQWVPLAGVVAAAFLAACAQPVQLPSDQAEAFARDVDPIVENCLIGLNEKDYAKHTRDFDSSMLDVVDTASFPQAYDEVIGVIGKYQSRKLVSVFDQEQFRIVVYQAQFEQDSNVTVRVVFTRADPSHKISGLWFDSDKLRAAKQK